MNHPLKKIQPKERPIIFILLLILTFLVMAVLNVTGRALHTAAAPAGIISYEIARDLRTAELILASWDQIARIYAGFNLGLDYLYLFTYSTTIALAVIWLSDALQLKRRLYNLAVILAWALWMAAIFDAVENTALTYMLLVKPIEPLPQLAWICAAIKFLIIATGLIYVLVAFIFQLIRWLRSYRKD